MLVLVVHGFFTCWDCHPAVDDKGKAACLACHDGAIATLVSDDHTAVECISCHDIHEGTTMSCFECHFDKIKKDEDTYEQK
jgi:hypothetical protein